MKPILKWLGGKSKLVEGIYSRFPNGFNDYWEPFLGSGALALHVFKNTTCRLFLSDCSPSLMNFYKVLQNDIEKVQLYANLIEIAKKFNENEDYSRTTLEDQEKIYYDYRLEYNTLEMSTIRKSAIFYFLNKTAFNGVMRYNSKGGYNVPFGKRGFPLDLNLLDEFATFLSSPRVKIYEGDFRHANPCEGDIVYLDPPYHPLTETANFGKYNSEGWSDEDEKEMREKCDLWSQSGAFILLSNHDVPFIRDLFAGYDFSEMDVRRSVGANSKTRKKVPEVLITKGLTT